MGIQLEGRQQEEISMIREARHEFTYQVKHGTHNTWSANVLRKLVTYIKFREHTSSRFSLHSNGQAAVTHVVNFAVHNLKRPPTLCPQNTQSYSGMPHHSFQTCMDLHKPFSQVNGSYITHENGRLK